MIIKSEDRNLTSSIVSQLGRAIVSGEYSSNAPFPIEAELCKKYGASRSAVREAVKMLTAKGLLSARPRQGTRVEPETNWYLLDNEVIEWFMQTRSSPSTVREIIELRLLIEPQGAALAAIRADKNDLEKIEAALQQIEQAESGHGDPTEADIAFHTAVLESTGNRFVIRVAVFNSIICRYTIPLTNRWAGFGLKSVEEHRAIFNAIKARNPELARKRSLDLLHSIITLTEEVERKGRK